MKIYLCVTPYFPTATSWRCPFIYDQVRAIQKTDKYRVVVVNTNSQVDYVYKGIEVYALRVYWRGLLLCPFLYELFNSFLLMKKMASIGIKYSDIEVIHTHLIQMAFFAKWAKRIAHHIKTIVQFHDADPYLTLAHKKGFGLWLKRIMAFRYYRSLAESVDMCVAISQNVKQVALTCPRQKVFIQHSSVLEAQKGLRCCRTPRLKKITVLHNGVDITCFNSSERTFHDGFVIGCIGNFTIIKDQLTLLKAINKIKAKLGNWKVRFIGSGPCLNLCKDYVATHGLQANVIFETEVNHTQLPEFYRSLDLFVLPSYFEGFGCVFTEAWACGVPFITCEGQGMDDLIPAEERKLWLFQPQNVEDLAKKILYFFKNRPTLKLSLPINIDMLIGNFLETVASLPTTQTE